MPTVIDGKRDQDRNEQVRKYDYVPERPNGAQRWSNGDWLVENLVGSLMAQENKDEVGEIKKRPRYQPHSKGRSETFLVKQGKSSRRPTHPEKVLYQRGRHFLSDARTSCALIAKTTAIRLRGGSLCQHFARLFADRH